MPPCSCMSGSRWTVTHSDGTTATYSSLTEAQADVTRNGGTITKTA